MSTQPAMSISTTADRRQALVEHLLASTVGTFDIFTIYLGDQLGFYEMLAADGALTSAELAARTGTQERYVREWLEQQAVRGILAVDDPAAAATERCYELPDGHADVLADRDHAEFLAPITQLLAGVVRPLPRLLEVFRQGGGIAFGEYGEDAREGQSRMNRVAYLEQLGGEWLPAIPDVHARLLADPPARIADLGCGTGWSSIGMARHYPSARVDGFDLDAPSIDAARVHAVEHEVADRVRFEARDAADPGTHGDYDLVIALECIHDMSDPVGVLRSMRRLVRDDGAVIVVDERVGECFATDASAGGDMDGMMYGWSVLCCLPCGLADAPSAATGTVMRPETLRRYAAEAGFTGVEILPIDHVFFRFYRLTR